MWAKIEFSPFIEEGGSFPYSGTVVERGDVMNSLNRRLKVISIVVCLSFLGYGIGNGADWKIYMEADIGSWFYDAETITRPSKDTVRVRGKTVYTDEGVMRRVTGMMTIYEKYKDLESKELASKYRDLNYEQNLIELNCADRKSRTLKGTAHSRDGLVLSTYTPEAPGWNEIMPATAAEDLWKILCMQEKSKESSLSRSQEEKPRTGVKMIVKIGEYSLGQNIKAIRGLVEFTPEEYSVFKSYPGWFNLPGEKIFKAPDITFNRRVWHLTVGALDGRIYILGLQYFTENRTAASSLLRETLGFVRSQMGVPTEQTKSPERYVWESTEGSVLLVQREAMGFSSINFLLTGPGR